jgi:hypothetical protein
MQLSYRRRSQSKDRVCNHLVRAAFVIAVLLLSRSADAAPAAKMPDFDAVTQMVQEYFESQSDHRDADLIRRSQVEGVLKSVAAADWKVDNAREIVALALPDNSFLVREFSSPAGKKFMRKVSAHPGGYSNLDRLSTINRGESIVRDLIRKPGGEDLIEYLATTKGGHNLGKTMAGTRGGVDLNKPTGRIYTAKDLLAVLQQAHRKAMTKPASVQR